MRFLFPRARAALVALVALSSSISAAQVPNYNLRFVGGDGPAAVNDHGDVVFNEAGRSWFASRTGSVEVLPLPPAATSSLARDVNDSSWIVGQVTGATIGSQAVLWRPEVSGGWSVTFVPTGSPFDSDATAVNELNDVIGWFTAGGTYVYNETDGFLDLYSFVPLGLAPWPADINDQRVVVGRNFFGRVSLVDLQSMTWEDLALPTGTGTNYQAVDANGLNDLGDICGRGVVATGGPNNDQALRYDAGTGTWTALNSPVPQAAAIDLDAAGNTLFAVGFSSPVLMFFEGAGTFDVEQLLAPQYQAWSLRFPGNISDGGTIVCLGFDPQSGANGIVVLSPTSGCAAASVVKRNMGNNPDVYTATTPTIGQGVTFTVDTQGFRFATIFGVGSPLARPLDSGDWLLIDVDSPFLLSTGRLNGPIAQTTQVVANDPGLCGVTIYTQAKLHGFARRPFRLTNSQDLILGN